ncbi:MAG: hypothetical protein P1U42_08705 [Phycisphaerales bacterium]|nr:hypothetical protein [Phycisphaerales bacterium]
MSKKKKSKHNSPSDAEILISHAEAMWESEISNFTRFENRGRLIVVSTTALLGFVTAVAIIGTPGKSLEALQHPASYYTSLMLLMSGYACIIYGVYSLIYSAKVFVAHGEEDAGSLPNPDQFADIGRHWWLTQPTIDTIEERYLLAIVVRRLRWFDGKQSWTSIWRMRFTRFFMERKIKNERELLYVEISKNKILHKLLCKKYEIYCRYGRPIPPDEGRVYKPAKDRGPRDIACIILAIELMIKQQELDRPHAKIAISEVINKSKKLRIMSKNYRIKLDKIGENGCKICRAKAAVKLKDHVTESILTNKAFIHSSLSRESKDFLHPPVVIKSSSYFLQFAEAFSWIYGGRSFFPPKIDNPTGSGRSYSELRRKSTNLNDVQWRSFASRYFAAQNLRSSNWNLWFRVKRAERAFLFSFSIIFIAFILVSMGEGLARSRLIDIAIFGYEKVINQPLDEVTSIKNR